MVIRVIVVDLSGSEASILDKSTPRILAEVDGATTENSLICQVQTASKTQRVECELINAAGCVVKDFTLLREGDVLFVKRINRNYHGNFRYLLGLIEFGLSTMGSLAMVETAIDDLGLPWNSRIKSIIQSQWWPLRILVLFACAYSSSQRYDVSVIVVILFHFFKAKQDPLGRFHKEKSKI